MFLFGHGRDQQRDICAAHALGQFGESAEDQLGERMVGGQRGVGRLLVAQRAVPVRAGHSAAAHHGVGGVPQQAEPSRVEGAPGKGRMIVSLLYRVTRALLALPFSAAGGHRARLVSEFPLNRTEGGWWGCSRR
ncbi:hypothetical protein [Streptomyces sp. WM6378]|uniref:hypothetical protein n=1 Tax=Streptomyces sp. WM6378 TaxID=1415557 RepID=UPI0006AE0E6F|nr:hypothetical protein [Streptomyces sp. WM6378]KOU52603.1 hypothetical protein ADK54_06890 [Streptomyces sp. WM6378]